MESGNAQRIELVFYQTDAGNVPVRDWLLGLAEANRREIGQDLQRIQFRWPVGMPLVRPMGKGLFEVRTSFARWHDRPRAVLLPSRRTLRTAWVHQEVAEGACS